MIQIRWETVILTTYVILFWSVEYYYIIMNINCISWGKIIEKCYYAWKHKCNSNTRNYITQSSFTAKMPLPSAHQYSIWNWYRDWHVVFLDEIQLELPPGEEVTASVDYFLGWTNEDVSGTICYDQLFDAKTSTLFRLSRGPSDLPQLNNTYSFDRLVYPAQASIAVYIDPCKCCIVEHVACINILTYVILLCLFRWCTYIRYV